MKRLIILIMLLTMNFCVNGQQGSDDSITVSVSSVRRAIQADIKREKAEKENEYLKASNDNLKILNKKTEDFNLSLQEQKREYELRWKECMKASEIADSINTANWNNAQKNFRIAKLRTAVTYGAVGIITGMVSIIIYDALKN